jgi:inorganic pyrophosphatase
MPNRAQDLPASQSRVRVVIDTPRLCFIKRRDDGRVDFVSPLPSPFNYGSVPSTTSHDGDRIDAIVLGPRLARGAEVERDVVAIARFVDAGVDDPKWICSDRPLSAADRALISAFFAIYVRMKRALNTLRGEPGPTRFDGLVERL